MDMVSFLREQLQGSHGFLEATLGDPTPEELHYDPPGRALPVGAAYAHVVISEDMLVQGMLKGGAPLSAGEQSIGVSEPMPGFDAEAWAGYAGWTQRVRIDLPALRAYAHKVYAASDAYLASLGEADLERTLDLSGMGMGTQTVAWFIGRILIGHVDNLTGEISAAKGVQGLHGYPV